MRAQGVRRGTSVPAPDWRFGSFFAKASFGAETRDEVLVGAATGCVAVVALDAGVVPASVAAGALGGVVTGLVLVGRGPGDSGPPLAGPELERDPAVPGAGIGAFAFGVPAPLEEWETDGDPCEAGVPVAALGAGTRSAAHRSSLPRRSLLSLRHRPSYTREAIQRRVCC